MSASGHSLSSIDFSAAAAAGIAFVASLCYYKETAHEVLTDTNLMYPTSFFIAFTSSSGKMSPCKGGAVLNCTPLS
jgi:hypothetical protein